MTKRKLPKKMPDVAFSVSEEDRELFLNAFYQGSTPKKYEDKKEKPQESHATRSAQVNDSIEELFLCEDEREIFLAYLDMGGTFTKEPSERKPLPKSRKNIDYDAKIDLHGDFSKDAEKRLLHFFNECEARGHKDVLIIHGRGAGVLRKVVMDILSNHPLVYDWNVAKARLGGAGAVLARLSTRKRRRRK